MMISRLPEKLPVTPKERVKKNQVTGSIHSTKGMPISIQSTKITAGACGYMVFTINTKTLFGGVPTSDPVPPMLAL